MPNLQVCMSHSKIMCVYGIRNTEYGDASSRWHQSHNSNIHIIYTKTYDGVFVHISHLVYIRVEALQWCSPVWSYCAEIKKITSHYGGASTQTHTSTHTFVHISVY